MATTCTIVFDSGTGNTERVARGLAERLRERGDIEVLGVVSARELATSGDASAAEADAGDAAGVAGPAAPVAAPASELVAQADAVLFGFWTDKGTCSPRAQAVLPLLAHKRVFLFGTAGFGGSEEYFERILGNVREVLSEGAAYLGGAMCQGRMGAGVKARYEAQAAAHPDEPRWQAMLQTYEQALAHPDAADIDRIADAACAALEASAA